MANTVGNSYRKDMRPVTTEAKSQDGTESSCHQTPAPLGRNIAEYISGYVDGEGCFTVTFNVRKKARLGLELRPSFSVSQNKEKSQVLYLMQKFFGCGYIRPTYRDKTLKYEVRNHEDLMFKIIPHFERYPLLSMKQKDFEIFKEICLIVDRKEHLAKNGFVRIINLAYKMNESGKRKRSKEELLNLLRGEDIV
jgi:hypothetical protein